MKTAQGDWQAFQRWLGDLRKESGRSILSSKLLFRGQGNSEWPLETTLERCGYQGMPLRDYYQLAVRQVGPAVETLAGVSVPQYDHDLLDRFGSVESILERFPSGPLADYMVYLRHYGFPSPLLDWSHSPYVAAFFAFRDENPEVAKRSIYAYCEHPVGIKGGAIGEPMIRSLGSYVRSHSRHFRQQSAYTVCESFEAGFGWRYGSHQLVFDQERPKQDYLWRFDLLSEERVDVLQLLNDSNLNAYFLFDSQESLLETMWLKEKVLNRR